MPERVTVRAKQPSEVLDYDFDFSDEMAAGENFVTTTVTVSADDEDTPALVLGAKVEDNATKRVKQWVSGGSAGVRYSLTCIATTTRTPATLERDMVIPVVDV